MTTETTTEAPATETAAEAPKPSKKVTAKKAGKKSAGTKGAKGAKAPAKKAATKAPAVSTPRREDGVSPNQVKILKALAKSRKGLTYGEIREATGIQKGLSALVSTGETSLENRKLVVSHEAQEGQGRAQYVFEITAKGREAAKA